MTYEKLMCTITITGGVSGNLLYYVENKKCNLFVIDVTMKHFSHFIETGAVRIETKGSWTGNTVAFENPDGSKVAIISNPSKEARELRLADGGVTYQLMLEPESFNTIVL